MFGRRQGSLIRLRDRCLGRGSIGGHTTVDSKVEAVLSVPAMVASYDEVIQVRIRLSEGLLPRPELIHLIRRRIIHTSAM